MVVLHILPKSYYWDLSTLHIPTTKLLKLCSVRHFVTTCLSKKHSYHINRMLTQCEGSVTCLNKLHANIIITGHGQNVFIGSKLISLYSELGQLHIKDARKVFDQMSQRDVFLWNMMIQTYANLGLSLEALDVYKDMCQQGLVLDKYTFTFVLKACGFIKDENSGRVIHGHVMKCGFYFDVFVGNALVALYAKCQVIEACKRVFYEIPQKDVVSWNSVIYGCAKNGFVNEALELFRTFLHDESFITIDYATLVSVLPACAACAQAADIRLGFLVHCYAIKTGLEDDAMVGSGLIATYANSGHLDHARHVFDRIPQPNIMVWTAMMRGYGMHGNPREAFDLFSNFLKDGLHPDGVVFLCLLSTCSHAGLVAKGREIFRQMEDYHVKRCPEHYACMVDLLGRAGLITEAVEFIKSMPMLPGKDAYGALLGACRMHNNNVELAQIIAEKLFVLDPDSGGRYVTLSKIYGDGGRLKDAAAVRNVMVKKNIKKQSGCSSVNVDSVVHTFWAKDETHIRSNEIFDTLEGLDKVMDEQSLLLQ